MLVILLINSKTLLRSDVHIDFFLLKEDFVWILITTA